MSMKVCKWKDTHHLSMRIITVTNGNTSKGLYTLPHFIQCMQVGRTNKSKNLGLHGMSVHYFKVSTKKQTTKLKDSRGRLWWYYLYLHCVFLHSVFCTQSLTQSVLHTSRTASYVTTRNLRIFAQTNFVSEF